MGDGFYPIDNTSVFKDREGKLPPIIRLFDDLPNPLGSTSYKAFIDAQVVEQHLTKRFGGTPKISGQFGRTLKAIAAWIGKYGIWLGIGILVIAAIVIQVKETGHL